MITKETATKPIHVGQRSTNPRKGTETHTALLPTCDLWYNQRSTNPRKGTETRTITIDADISRSRQRSTNPRKGTETLYAIWVPL